MQVSNYESEKFLFRELTMVDVNRLFAIYSDREAMRFRNSKAMTQLDDARQFVANQVVKTEAKTVIRKGIEFKEENELIGTVMYKYIPNAPDECLLGYSLAADCWGKGLGRQVLSCLVESFNEQPEIKRLKAWVIKENIASKRILEINKFQIQEQQEFPQSYLFVRELA